MDQKQLMPYQYIGIPPVFKANRVPIQKIPIGDGSTEYR